MESDLLDAWSDDLYWICLKYDLDPYNQRHKDMVEEIWESGWSDGNVTGYDDGLDDGENGRGHRDE